MGPYRPCATGSASAVCACSRSHWRSQWHTFFARIECPVTSGRHTRSTYRFHPKSADAFARQRVSPKVVWPTRRSRDKYSCEEQEPTRSKNVPLTSASTTIRRTLKRWRRNTDVRRERSAARYGFRASGEADRRGELRVRRIARARRIARHVGRARRRTGGAITRRNTGRTRRGADAVAALPPRFRACTRSTCRSRPP